MRGRTHIHWEADIDIGIPLQAQRRRSWLCRVIVLRWLLRRHVVGRRGSVRPLVGSFLILVMFFIVRGEALFFLLIVEILSFFSRIVIGRVRIGGIVRRMSSLVMILISIFCLSLKFRLAILGLMPKGLLVEFFRFCLHRRIAVF